MGVIGNAVTALPAAGRILTHSQLSGQLRDRLLGRLNVLAGLWSRRRIGRQVDVHGVCSAIEVDTISSMISLVRNKERSSKRQAAPFSEGKKKANPKKPGRKPGEGKFSRRDLPTEEKITHESKCRCKGISARSMAAH